MASPSDELRELRKHITLLEQKVDTVYDYVLSTRPNYDATLLAQKLHSVRVQLSMKRRCIIQLRADKEALRRYIKELENINGLPSDENLP